jgi:hypothetical protein
MDTFAELTDQRFRHRTERWGFSCHYSDLHHSPEFQAEFDCEGLLPVEQMAATYGTFTQWFTSRYPGVPLYVVDFSAALDDRLNFRQRAAAIRSALLSLSRQHSALRVLSLPEDQIEKAEGDDFAYHFSPRTVQRFAALWQEALNQGDRRGTD